MKIPDTMDIGIMISRLFSCFRLPPRLPARLAAVFLALTVAVKFPGPLPASEVTTDPVGVMSIRVPAVSDVIVSAPLQRPAAYAGLVGGVDSAEITVAEAPGWTPDQFVYGEGTQPETYYCQITTGVLRGAFFTIVGNGSDTLTLDLNGESLDGLSIGDAVTVRPYWTLGRLFGPESGFPGSPTLTPRALVQMVSPDTPGINLSPTSQLFYYDGALFGGPGWRRTGTSPTQRFDDVILYPDVAFRIRNSLAEAIELPNMGAVPMAGQRMMIGTLQANVPQDNFVALMSATDTTLAASGLVECGALAGSATLTPVDSLQVFDNAASGINKVAAHVYFYYTGVLFGGPGWRRTGTNPTTRFDDEIMRTHDGYIIRKTARPSPQSSVWLHFPDYITP